MTPEVRRILGAQRAEVRHLIAYEMRRKGFTSSALADAIGISANSVSRVMAGAMHSPRILNAMREIGVPEEYLFDPRRVPAPTLGKVG